MMALSMLAITFGREIALPLDDLAIAIEDDGRRPAVVLIAIGQIGA